jgi:putative aminopeptidase FrvX
VRYVHSHASILHRGDFEQAARLLVAVIQRLDAEMVQHLKG